MIHISYASDDSSRGEEIMFASSKIVGKRIYRVRGDFDNKMTQEDLAKGTGISLAMINRIESGKREAGINQLGSIINHFNSACVLEEREIYTVEELCKGRGFRVHERHQPDLRPAREGDG